jgi:hypothetical protein
MGQGQKHWIQAVLGENPYLPYPYNYDVTTWSYPLTRGIAGSGFLKAPLPPYVSLTEIGDPGYGTVSNSGSPVYAFDTDSAQALGMVTELLAKGAKVYRAAASFSAANHKFSTGAALVDGSSLGSINLPALAAQRETPVYGLSRYPVDRYAIAKPKIGLFTNTATAPANPIQLNGAAKSACGGLNCEALFVLTQKMKIPTELISYVTTSDLTAGNLVSGGYTAFINATTAITNTDQLNAIKAFVNGGGRYLGELTSGTTTARSAGLTRLAQVSIAGLNTPGSLYDAKFDTTNPVAWGYDAGGWLYRDLGNGQSNPVPVYDPLSLAGDGTIPNAKAAVSYGGVLPANDPKFPNQMYGYGFDVNARGPQQLANRPAVVDQPFGAGRAILFGMNPFYRAWLDGEERLVGNAILFPLSAPIAPNQSASSPAAEPVADPIPASKLPASANRPGKVTHNTARDLMIQVKRSQAASLKRAVGGAKLSKKLRAKVRYVNTRTTTTLVMRNVRSDDPHAREAWVIRIMDGLAHRRVRAISAQV